MMDFTEYRSNTEPAEFTKHDFSKDHEAESAGLSTCRRFDPFPAADERPCYRAYEHQVKRPDGSWAGPGVYYHDIKKGSGDDQDKCTDTYICAWLHVLRRVRDNNGQGWGRLVEFKDFDWNEKRIIISNADFQKTNRNEIAATLAYEGLDIASRKGPQVVNYVEQAKLDTDEPHTIVDYTGWYGKDLESFVLPDETIGQDSVLYHCGGSTKAVTCYRSAGELEGWQSNIADYAIGNPRLQLALCAAFAGPLFKLLNRGGAGVHFHGKSSTGKSTSLYVGASVWGHGKEFIHMWNGTANGFEGAARLHSDTLLCLDEIHTATGRDVDRVVYSLINGEGRLRANRNGQAKDIARWDIAVISTGEITIKDAIEADGRSHKAGQAVRILDIPATGPYGMFDRIPDDMDSPEQFAKHLAECSKVHYGLAGPAFVRYLMENQDSLKKTYDLVYHELLTDDLDRILNNQQKRALDSLAVMATAGVLAIEAGILKSWEPKDCIEAMRQIFELCRPELGRCGKDIETTKILENISSFIKSNMRRFLPKDAEEFNVSDMAGFMTHADGEIEYLFFFKKALIEAADQKRLKTITDALRSAGVLECRDPSNIQHYVKKGFGNAYKIDVGRLEAVVNDLEKGS